MKSLPCIENPIPMTGIQQDPLTRGRWWELPGYRARNRIGDFSSRKKHKREDFTKEEDDL